MLLPDTEDKDLVKQIAESKSILTNLIDIKNTAFSNQLNEYELACVDGAMTQIKLLLGSLLVRKEID